MNKKVVVYGRIEDIAPGAGIGDSILVEIHLDDIEDEIEDYAAFVLGMVEEVDCDCYEPECNLEDFWVEDMAEHLEHEGYTVLKAGTNLRESMVFNELRDNYDKGLIPFEEIEKLNVKYGV